MQLPTRSGEDSRSPAPGPSLRKKVGAGALLLTLASLLMLTLAWNGLSRMERAQARANNANGLQIAGETLLRAAGELMLTQGSLSARDGTRSAAQDTRRHLDLLGSSDAGIATATTHWTMLETRVEALLAIRLIDVEDTESLINYGALIQGMEEFLPGVRDARQRADLEARDALRSATAWLVSGLVGLTALAALAGLALLRMLDRQLGGDPSVARSVSQRIAAGDLESPVPHDGTHPHSVMAELENVRIKLLERRAIEERVRYLARHDVLSGALNRGSFNELLSLSIEQARRGAGSMAVLYIDLDRFKEVNDSLGHAQGDEVIRLTAQRLRELLRRGDHLARLGGDEFAIIAHELHSGNDIEHLCRRVVEAVSKPMPIAGKDVSIGASVGVALLDGQVHDREDLLHKADLAMYRAKSNGRGGFSIYDDHLDGKLRERRDLVRDLRAAIGSERMFLHYQPIFARDARRLLGYEALLRWQHPERGLIPPDEFIPLAEDAGLIDSIGDWVLEQACSDAARWPAHLSLSVNLSVAQMENGRLVEQIAGVLDRSGMTPGRLNVEITETMLMSHRETIVRTLEGLAALGVGIVMDDFGTGYSSLAYLWRFEFNKLKIDRSFIAGLDTDPKVRTVVESIVSLAHALGMSVTAEGIERTDQLSMVQLNQCDELQGFLLGRPGPAPDD